MRSYERYIFGVEKICELEEHFSKEGVIFKWWLHIISSHPVNFGVQRTWGIGEIFFSWCGRDIVNKFSFIKTRRTFCFSFPLLRRCSQSVHRKCHSIFILKLEWKRTFLGISISNQNWKLKNDKNFNFQFFLEKNPFFIFQFLNLIAELRK